MAKPAETPVETSMIGAPARSGRPSGSPVIDISPPIAWNRMSVPGRLE